MNTEICSIIKIFCEILHGSGIDYDWSIIETKKSITCFNSYHAMNDMGYYDRIIDFKIIFPKDDLSKFTVNCTNDRYGYEKYSLGEYLPDQISYALKESIKKHQEKKS